MATLILLRIVTGKKHCSILLSLGPVNDFLVLINYSKETDNIVCGSRLHFFPLICWHSSLKSSKRRKAYSSFLKLFKILTLWRLSTSVQDYSKGPDPIANNEDVHIWFEMQGGVNFNATCQRYYSSWNFRCYFLPLWKINIYFNVSRRNFCILLHAFI